jgi:hypothetical protein
MAANLDRIEKVFETSSPMYKVTRTKLITRAGENFTAEGLTYASIFQGLLENGAGVE